MYAYFGFVIAVVVTMVLIPPLIRLAAHMQIVDVPDARKVHAVAIPRIGGIAMATGALLPMVLWTYPDRYFVSFVMGALIIVGFGFWDDRRDLDYRLKFLGQIVAVLIVVVYGDIVVRYVPFYGLDPIPDWVAIPLTVFALLGITNAINLADGLDGLAGGTTMLSLGVVALLAYLADGSRLMLMAVAVMGGILGFLRYNTHPARIFMGDAGSQFLGFALGVLVIRLTQNVNSALSPAVALMLLGLPIFDTLMVMGQRIYEGRSPFSPDKNHIHHKLLAVGFSHYDAVVAIYLLQSLFVLGAYFFRFQADMVIVLAYVSICAALLFYLKVAGQRGDARRVAAAARPSRVTRLVHWLAADERLVKSAFRAAVFVVALYLLAGAFMVRDVPMDIGVSSLILALVLGVAAFLRRGPVGWVDRGVAYGAVAFVVYLTEVAPGRFAVLAPAMTGLLVLLGVAIAVTFRFSRQDRFRISPLDFIVLFVAIVVPSLPEGHADIGSAALKMLVLFYGLELVIEHTKRRVGVMRAGLCVTLLTLGLRALM